MAFQFQRKEISRTSPARLATVELLPGLWATHITCFLHSPEGPIKCQQSAACSGYLAGGLQLSLCPDCLKRKIYPISSPIFAPIGQADPGGGPWGLLEVINFPGLVGPRKKTGSLPLAPRCDCNNSSGNFTFSPHQAPSTSALSDRDPLTPVFPAFEQHTQIIPGLLDVRLLTY